MKISRRKLMGFSIVGAATAAELYLELNGSGLSKLLSSDYPNELNRYGELMVLPNSGTLFAASDFHGRYGDLKAWLSQTGVKDNMLDGQNVYAVILGDAVDIKNGDKYAEKDGDLKVVKEIQKIQESENGERFIYLTGNHEAEDVRGYSLKNSDYSNENIEKYLSEFNFINRMDDNMAKYLSGLPIALLTKNGVVGTHAGPSKEVKSPKDLEHPLPNIRGNLLWTRPKPADALSGYSIQTVRDFLKVLNDSKVLITGHTPLNGMPGVFVNNDNLAGVFGDQILLATSYGSREERRGSYLELDLSKKIAGVMDIIRTDDVKLIDYNQKDVISTTP